MKMNHEIQAVNGYLKTLGNVFFVESAVDVLRRP